MSSNNLAFNHTTDVSGPVEFFFQVPNRLTGGVYGIVLLGSIFAISFISMQRFGMERSFTASSFITFLSAVMFAAFGIVSSPVVVGTAVMLLVGIMIGTNGGPK